MELTTKEQDLVTRFVVNETVSEWNIHVNDGAAMLKARQEISNCASEFELKALCEKYEIIFLDPLCMSDYESIAYHIDEQVSIFTNFALAMKNL